MFVSCYKAENYWLGRVFFFYNFLVFFFFRIVMHHNAAKSNNRFLYISFDIFTLYDKIRHVLKLSIWFNVNSHGRVTGNKHIFFLLVQPADLKKVS